MSDSFLEYQRGVKRTMSPTQTYPEQLANFALGLAGEVGEVTEPIKKHLFHGKELNTVALSKELGDVLWYLTALAESLGLDLDTIAESNLAKLRERYPEGFRKVGE